MKFIETRTYGFSFVLNSILKHLVGIHVIRLIPPTAMTTQGENEK